MQYVQNSFIINSGKDNKDRGVNSVFDYTYKVLHFLSKNTKISNAFFLLQIILFLLLFFLYVIKTQTLFFLPGHHGNVSAEQISMMDGANYDNGFISPKFTVEGKGDYYPRYSVITNILLHPILSQCQTISSKLRAIRFVMDIILFINIFLTTHILSKLLRNRVAPLLGSILATSSYIVTTYHDLPSPDSFLVLSFLLSFLSIIKFEKKHFIQSIIFIILSLSFGYLILNIIPYIFYSIFLITTKIKIRKKLLLFSFILFIPSCLSLFLYSYNIYKEASVEECPIEKTSIYQTTIKRSGNYTDDYYNDYLKGKIEFYNYYPFYIKNAYVMAIKPFSAIKKNIERLWYIFLVICTFSLVLSNINNKKSCLNITKIRYSIKEKLPINNFHLLVIMFFSSCFTLFILKGFVIIHDFGFISLYIMSATTFTVIFKLINQNFLKYVIFPFILFFFATSYKNIQIQNNENRETGNAYIQDFENIQKKIKNKNDSFMLEDNFNIFPTAIYGMGIYLNHHNIETMKEKSTFYLSKEKRTNTLTPNNKIIYMYCSNE